MKSLKIILLTIFLAIGATSAIYATDDTTVQDLVGTTEDKTTTTKEVTPTEENPLGLDLPSQSDNPSTIMTFTNPGPDGSGVQLEIDSKGFVDINSPYTLPALSIGKHTLEFKYQDANSATQLYSTSIIIIPRAPVLDTPVINADTVIVSGTGLANSEVIVFLSSGTLVMTETADIDDEGKWTISFGRTTVINDIYSVGAYTRRYGYASDLSEITIFTLDMNSNTSKGGSQYIFDLSTLSIDVVKNWVVNNQTYILITLCAFVLGVIAGIVSKTTRIKNLNKKAEKKVENEFHKIKPAEKEVTLREKLMEKREAPKEAPAPIEEKHEEPAVINKLDFLKDFKKFDPDTNDEKAKEPQVEVSLTSKK